MTHRFRSITAIVLAGLLLIACAASPVAAASSRGRWLKIRVFEKDAATPTVLVNLPMGLVSAFLRLARRSEGHVSVDLSGEDKDKTRLRVKDVDLDEVIRELETMDPGQIVEVQDGDERISIWIE